MTTTPLPRRRRSGAARAAFAVLAGALAATGCVQIDRRAAENRSTTVPLPASDALHPAPPVHDSGHLVSGGRTRSYLLQVPDRLASPRSLVLMLHGGGGTGKGQAKVSGYGAVASRYGFIVAYPEGVDKNWNDGRGATVPDHLHIDDVAFLSALIDKVRAEYAVPAGRVFATGLSNGAFMVQRLACERPDEVAAIAPVAGTLAAGVACTPSRPVSVFEIHGRSDRIVPYAGGTMTGRGGKSTIVSAPGQAATWRRLDSCPPTPEVVQRSGHGDGTSVTQQTWSRCADGSAVVLDSVNGGGHTWPGGWQYLPRFVVGRTTSAFSASLETWAFFATHARG